MTPTTALESLYRRFKAYDLPDPAADGPISENSRVLVWWLCAGLWFCVLTQRIALPPANIELPFFGGVGLVAMLFLRGYLVLDLRRAVPYFFFMAVLLTEQVFTPFREAFSVPALLAAICYYAVFMFVAPVERSALFKVMRNFVNISTLVATLVFVDWVFNLTHHAIPNMDKFVPENFIFLHYVYIQPVHWMSPYTKPNAFFMLEASHTSQMIAMGMVVEFCTRQNLIRLGYLSLALLATYAGTGILLLVIATPFLISRARSSTLLVALMIAPLVIGGAAAKGLLTDYTKRQVEFGEQGQSANSRFVWPYQLAWQQLNYDFHDAFLGVGASNAEHDARLPVYIKGNPNGAPAYGTPTKLIIEFGIVIAVLWTAFFFFVMTGSQLPFPIVLMLLIQYEVLNGGLLVPVEVFYCYLISAVFVKPNPKWLISRQLADYVPPPQPALGGRRALT